MMSVNTGQCALCTQHVQFVRVYFHTLHEVQPKLLEVHTNCLIIDFECIQKTMQSIPSSVIYCSTHNNYFDTRRKIKKTTRKKYHAVLE